MCVSHRVLGPVGDISPLPALGGAGERQGQASPASYQLCDLRQILKFCDTSAFASRKGDDNSGDLEIAGSTRRVHVPGPVPPLPLGTHALGALQLEDRLGAPREGLTARPECF